MAKTLISPETLNSFRELQTPKDPNFFREFLTALLNGIPGHLETIRTAIETGDPQKIALSAHAIKSSCLNIGVTPITTLCAKLEELSKKGSLVGAQELYTETMQLCATLKREIHALPEFLNPK